VQLASCGDTRGQSRLASDSIGTWFLLKPSTSLNRIEVSKLCDVPIDQVSGKEIGMDFLFAILSQLLHLTARVEMIDPGRANDWRTKNDIRHKYRIERIAWWEIRYIVA